MSDNKVVNSNRNQGEGDREAARRYEQTTKDFIQSGKVDPAVKQARDQNPAEGKEAENQGRKRAKGEDPAITRKP